MTLKDLKDKRVLILGIGKEGLNTLKFLRLTFLNKLIGIGDELPFPKINSPIRKFLNKDKNLSLHFGKNCLAGLKDYEVIIKTPGFSPFRPVIKRAKKQGIILTSQTEIFFNNCPGTIVGITGTKGKSTTALLAYRILKENGLNTRLVGNIGKPGLLLLEKAKRETIFVYELSSHQLYSLKKSPQIAVFLNIFPEHGDYYPTFDDYVSAKKNITLYQNPSDYFIYNSSFPLLEKIGTTTKAKKMPFSSGAKKDPVCFLKNDYLVWRSKQMEEKIIKISQVPLLGKFNLQNVMPAIIVGKIFKIPSEKIAQTIKNFKPLPHRLERCGSYRGIAFYDDSISTIPETAIAALDALGFDVQTILLGGFERGQSFTKLAQRILKSEIKTIVLFPTTGQRIWKEILRQKKTKITLPKHFFVDNMKEAIKLAYQHTNKGKTCLLSPASPSFGLFKDYKERGNLFKKYAKSLSSSKRFCG
jgi:UDP-N-acetylmuramoylalanine--D-glutamate ligase